MSPISLLLFFKRHAPLKQVSAAALAGLLTSLSGLLLMGTSAYIIASAAKRPPLYTLALAITLVRTAGLSRAVFRYLDRYLSHRAAFALLSRLRLRLFRGAAERLPLKSGSIGEGEWLHLLSDGTELWRDFYLRVIAPPCNTLLLTIMVACWVYAVSPAAAVILLLVWLGSLAVPYWLLNRQDMEQKETAAARYRSKLLDILAGLEELRPTGSRQLARQMLDDAGGALRRREEATLRRQSSAHAALNWLTQITLLAILGLLIRAACLNIIGGVELAVYFLALQALMLELTALPKAVYIWQQAWPVAEGFRRAVSEAPPANAVTEASACKSRAANELLGLADVDFAYQNSAPVLRHLNLSLRQGTTAAIVGESGSGKTTLGGLLLGLFPPDGGHVFWQGNDVGALPPGIIRDKAAAALGGSYLFSGSLRDNFRLLHGEISDEEILAALDKAGLSDLVATLPQGLSAYIGEDGAGLSGGERTRLTVALALAKRATLTILDEPTAGLDRERATLLTAAIVKHFGENPACSLLVITHDNELAKAMDCRWRLENGQLDQQA